MSPCWRPASGGNGQGRHDDQDTQDPDPTTSNLLQEIEHGIDKYQWQMRAFVQGTHIDPNTGFDINNNKPVDLPSQPSKIDPNATQCVFHKAATDRSRERFNAAFFQPASLSSVYAADAVVRHGRASNRCIRGSAWFLRASDT